MDKATLFEQFSKALLNKFLIHFAPGTILFFTFLSLTDVRIDRGLLSSLIIVSFAWVLGLVLEIVFFKKSYEYRTKNDLDSIKPIHYLLISKVGLAILFSVAVNAFLGVMEILPEPRDFHPSLVFILAVKTVIFGVLGLFLFLFFRKAPQD